MQPPQLPPLVAELLTALNAVQPPPASIWLIGSRANGRATHSSDTDLLVFADNAYLDSIRATMDAPCQADVLVDVDGINFQDPWKCKRGSLVAWSWSLASESRANYVGRKFVPDSDAEDEDDQNSCDHEGEAVHIELGQSVEYREQAIRLYPRDDA